MAFVLVHMCVDGTPLYRLARAFERVGVPVSHGALERWMIGSTERHLSCIYDAQKLRFSAQPLIHSDKTSVQVLKGKGQGGHQHILHVGLSEYRPHVTAYAHGRRHPSRLGTAV